MQKPCDMTTCPSIILRLGRFGLLAVAVMLTGACRKQPALQSILPQHTQLKAGDVVFRQGNGLTSRAVRAADADGRFSHIGIVADSAGVLQIIHAVPDEPDFPGDPDRVKMERPERFFRPHYASCGKVMRPRNEQAAKAAAQKAYEVYARGTMFDHDYNDRDTTQMYCCELIDHCFRAAHYPLIGNERHQYRLPGIDFDHLILPSDFLRSPRLTNVADF